jgi:RND family efflux transporter MFP subunit
MTTGSPVRVRPFVASACALLVLATSCKRADPEEETPTPVVTAKTAPVSMEPFTRTQSAIGVVVGRPGRYAALSAPSATRIAKVHVAQGQRVGEGQSLVEFEQAQFVAAASAAQSALSAAERAYERAQRLANDGIVPRKDAEAAAADLAKARNDAVTARRAVQLSVLRSPVSGVVTRMSAVLGASADPAQVLVEIADPSAFDVILALGPSEAAAVHPGAQVELSAGEKTGGESLGSGSVASVDAAVDTLSRSVQIRVSVTKPRRVLRLGESVFGVIAVETRPTAVVIPVEALVPGEEPGSYRVFVVDKGGIAHAREVQVGGRTEVKAEIVEGLKGSEIVVTQGAYALEDSAKIARPVPVKP